MGCFTATDTWPQRSMYASPAGAASQEHSLKEIGAWDTLSSMSKRKAPPPTSPDKPVKTAARRPSALIDTRVIYCGDNLDQLRKLPNGCIDLIYIDPPFNSNRNYEVFWGETKEKRAFEDRHASTQAYIDYMRPRCIEANARQARGRVRAGVTHVTCVRSGLR